MTIGGELPVLRETLERVGLETRRVVVEVVEESRLEDEEATVDPTLADLWLLGELRDEVALEDEPAEARGRSHRSDGRDPAVAPVEAKELAEVDIGDAVAVRGHERLPVEQRSQTADAPAGARLETGVDDMHDPVLDGAALGLHVAGPEVDPEASVKRRVVEEVLLDQVALVARGDHELVQPMRGVVAHDVPEERAPADFHERLRPRVGLFREPGPVPAREDRDLHPLLVDAMDVLVRMPEGSIGAIGRCRPRSGRDRIIAACPLGEP